MALIDKIRKNITREIPEELVRKINPNLLGAFGTEKLNSLIKKSPRKKTNDTTKQGGEN